jgi:hypothetical protein
MQLDAITAAVKWLGALSGGEALATSVGAFVATVIGVCWPVVRAVRKQRKLDMEAIGPVAPMAPPPAAPAAAPLPPELAEVVRVVGEWTLADARQRVRSLEALEKRLRAEIDQMRVDLEEATADNVRLSRAVATANLSLERAIHDRDAAEARARAISDEMRRLKIEMSSGHHGSAAVTPLRPPGRP